MQFVSHARTFVAYALHEIKVSERVITGQITKQEVYINLLSTWVFCDHRGTINLGWTYLKQARILVAFASAKRLLFVVLFSSYRPIGFRTCKSDNYTRMLEINPLLVFQRSHKEFTNFNF